MRTAEIDFTPFLLATALLLGLLIQAIFHATPIPNAPIGRQRPAADRFSLGSLSLDLPDYPNLLQNPLFSAGSAAGVGAPDAAPEGSFSLLGLVKDGAQASVVIRSADAAIHTVKIGQAILGWRLAAAGAGRAVLVRDGVSQTLVLGAPPKATSTSLSSGERP